LTQDWQNGIFVNEIFVNEILILNVANREIQNVIF
jgi:hypothetical protein